MGPVGALPVLESYAGIPILFRRLAGPPPPCSHLLRGHPEHVDASFSRARRKVENRFGAADSALNVSETGPAQGHYYVDAKTGKVVITLGEKINFLSAKKLANGGLKDIFVSRESLFGKFLHEDIKISDEEEGIFKIGTELNDTVIQQILDANIHSLNISVTNSINKGPYLLSTILNDKNNTKDEAITEIYKMLRPGEPPTIEIAEQIFNNLFFSSDRYDLSDVGRVKMNSRLNLECSDKITILRNDDIVAIIHKMLELRDGKDEVDDIDHLGNRRVRSVGELSLIHI